MSTTLTLLANGLWLGSTYALIALGMVLAFRATRTLNFAHGELMLLAGYVVAKLEANHTLPAYVAVVVAIVATSVAAALVYLLALRRTTGMQMFVAVVVTIGVASVGDGLMAWGFGPNDQYLSLPGIPGSVLSVSGARVSLFTIVLGGFSFCLAVAVALVLRYTRVGMRLRAAGQNPLLASQGGVHVERIYTASWAAAGALAAVAGICYGASNVVNVSVTALALNAFPAMLLGGLDSIGGAILGGIIIGMIQTAVSIWGNGQLAGVSSYIVLLLVLLVLPHGLFGTREVARV
jgi:branched-chain amino acid transport system permease protein